ncbi:hypothetical protein BHE74_00031574 [Ensete ventricosum]|nr:hypothetical protein GW17_00046935 [Ensete ventricosum]RWW61370.1 hypothetical protein BHE74_00031574 [Ensete ventricosum]
MARPSTRATARGQAIEAVICGHPTRGGACPWLGRRGNTHPRPCRRGTTRGYEHDEREVGYSPQAEEAQSSAPNGKRCHNERLSMVETHLDILEASLKELYQGQERPLRVERLQEDAESQIDRVESLVDRLIEDTKDSV